MELSFSDSGSKLCEYKIIFHIGNKLLTDILDYKSNILILSKIMRYLTEKSTVKDVYKLKRKRKLQNK